MRNGHHFLLVALLATISLINAKTSFLILIVDDIGIADMEYANGNKALTKTPTITKLANSDSAIQLLRFRSEATCTPSRIAILSGRSPLRDCVWGTPIPKCK